MIIIIDIDELYPYYKIDFTPTDEEIKWEKQWNNVFNLSEEKAEQYKKTLDEFRKMQEELKTMHNNKRDKP